MWTNRNSPTRGSSMTTHGLASQASAPSSGSRLQRPPPVAASRRRGGASVSPVPPGRILVFHAHGRGADTREVVCASIEYVLPRTHRRPMPMTAGASYDWAIHPAVCLERSIVGHRDSHGADPWTCLGDVTADWARRLMPVSTGVDALSSSRMTVPEGGILLVRCMCGDMATRKSACSETLHGRSKRHLSKSRGAGRRSPRGPRILRSG